MALTATPSWCGGFGCWPRPGVGLRVLCVVVVVVVVVVVGVGVVVGLVGVLVLVVSLPCLGCGVFGLSLDQEGKGGRHSFLRTGKQDEALRTGPPGPGRALAFYRANCILLI